MENGLELQVGKANAILLDFLLQILMGWSFYGQLKNQMAELPLIIMLTGQEMKSLCRQ